MYNYKLVIEYDGKDFKGWQKQKYTKDTIQEQIVIAVEKILREKIRLVGAGRTDSGVSAYNQVANFHYSGKIDLAGFKYSLNSILPDSVTVKNIRNISSEFHSRYSAVKREYLYKISFMKKSIGRDEYYRINYGLNFLEIERFIKFILSQINFYSFCKNNEDKNNFSCNIFNFRYRFVKSKNELVFSITANRFLHSMVRCIVGCALEIGRGKLSLITLQEKINKGEKVKVHYLPAHALFLNKIYY